MSKRQAPPQLDEAILFKLATNPEAVQLVLDFFEKQQKQQNAEKRKAQRKNVPRYKVNKNGGGGPGPATTVTKNNNNNNNQR